MLHSATAPRALLLLGALVLLGAAPAEAQFARGFSNSGIAGSDVTVAGTAAESLFTGVEPRPGQHVEWTNPETGSTGSVEITAIETSPPCISLRHKVRTTTGLEREVNTRRCQDAQGRWLLETQ